MAIEPIQIPHGTQVLVRIPVDEHPAGTSAVVIAQHRMAADRYTVRYPDGSEEMVHRANLTILKTAEKDQFQPDTKFERYKDYVIYSALVGSRAYGLATDDSDEDIRGIYLPPTSLHWSLRGVPEQLENSEGDGVFWELEKFMKMALNANPNVLEVLYSPFGESRTSVAETLVNERQIFLSKRVFATYQGYAMSQFKKLEQDLRAQGTIRWKHAMHLIRLLLSGVHILTHEDVLVDVGEHRDALLAIRRGEVPWAEVDAWRDSLHRQFEKAYTETRLPDRPDYDRASETLVWARYMMANEEYFG